MPARSKKYILLVQILIRNHRKKWQYVGRAKVSTQNAFQRAGSPKWDWLVVFQQSCSITTLVDAITTAWEHWLYFHSPYVLTRNPKKQFAKAPRYFFIHFRPRFSYRWVSNLNWLMMTILEILRHSALGSESAQTQHSLSGFELHSATGKALPCGAMEPKFWVRCVSSSDFAPQPRLGVHQLI